MDGILYPLWDLGLKVGHSVRSIEDCVNAANDDMQSKTSLIEARLITGSEALFKKFQKTVLNKCVEGYEDKYIAARLAGPGRAPRQVRQFPLHAGAEHQERLRRPARLSEPALDGVLQVPHPLARGIAAARTHQRSRAQATRGRLRFSAARPQRAALSRRPAGGRADQKRATRRRAQSRLHRPFAERAAREIHARGLHPRAQHLSHQPHARTAPGPAARGPSGCEFIRGFIGRRRGRPNSSRSWMASNSSTATSMPPSPRVFATSRAG